MAPALKAAKARIAKTAKAVAGKVANPIKGFFLFALSPPLWFLALFVAGAALVVHSVRILAGDAWADMAAGGFCFLCAALIRKGMTNV